MLDISEPKSYSDKQITIFGANRSGIAIARLLYGFGANIILTDTLCKDMLSTELEPLNGMSIEYKLGGHEESCIANTELIIVSPGVPLDIPILCEAKRRSISILGELEISAALCQAPIVAITGTKGKSTTTLLTATILEKNNSFSNVLVAGNIGDPLANKVSTLSEQDIVVVEASSFQLESTSIFRPTVSLFLNFSRDHLDRHKTMDAYFNAKRKIYANQAESDWIVLNATDTKIKRLSHDTIANIAYFTDDLRYTNKGLRYFCEELGCKIGVGLHKNGDEISIINYRNEQEELICNIDEIPLAGSHNIRNVLAATVVGTIYSVSVSDIRQAILNFDKKHAALEHAYEKVCVINGVDYINDSKATNVIATSAALESIIKSTSAGKDIKRTFLIIGGFDKGNNYEPLIELVSESVKCLILLGEHTKNIQQSLKGCAKIHYTSSMKEAVDYAYRNAVQGEIVLLSPANASFDMYSDYKERGEDFKDAVKSLNIKS